MAEFRIDTGSISKQSANTKDIGKSLNRLSGDIEQSNHALVNIGGAVGSIVQSKLIAISKEVMAEAVKMNSLAEAMGYIIQQYDSTEANLAGAQAQHEAPSNKKKGKASKTIAAEASFFDTFKKWLEKFFGNKYVSREEEKKADLAMQSAIFDVMDSDEFSMEAWDKASLAEREQMLMRFCEKVCAILGIPGMVVVSVEKMDARYNGSWDGKTIRINSLHLNDPDSYNLMRTVIHESRHAYQTAAVKNPEKFNVSKETIKQWKENNKPGNYKATSKGDPWPVYAAQPIEWDAMNFAGQDYYTDLIQNPVYRGSW